MVIAFRPPAETREQALVRLARKARAEGVRIFRDERDGRHYATSTSQPGHLHYVTGHSCDCVGFAHHERCKHHAALLAALGWIEDAVEPTPAMTVATHHVAGHYARGGWLVGGMPEWREQVTTIAVDGIDKLRVSGGQYHIRVQWLEQGRPVDDLTDCTPGGVTHAEAVRYWLESLGPAVPAASAEPPGPAEPTVLFPRRRAA